MNFCLLILHLEFKFKKIYTDEEKKFALEICYAMGLKHSYWEDQYGINYTDEVLECNYKIFPYDKELEEKYKKYITK